MTERTFIVYIHYVFNWKMKHTQVKMYWFVCVCMHTLRLNYIFVVHFISS